MRDVRTRERLQDEFKLMVWFGVLWTEPPWGQALPIISKKLPHCLGHTNLQRRRPRWSGANKVRLNKRQTSRNFPGGIVAEEAISIMLQTEQALQSKQKALEKVNEAETLQWMTWTGMEVKMLTSCQLLSCFSGEQPNLCWRRE